MDELGSKFSGLIAVGPGKERGGHLDLGGQDIVLLQRFGACLGRLRNLSGAIAPLPSVAAEGGRHLPQGRVVAPVRWTVETAAFANHRMLVDGNTIRYNSSPRDGGGIFAKVFTDAVAPGQTYSWRPSTRYRTPFHVV